MDLASFSVALRFPPVWTCGCTGPVRGSFSFFGRIGVCGLDVGAMSPAQSPTGDPGSIPGATVGPFFVQRQSCKEKASRKFKPQDSQDYTLFISFPVYYTLEI